MNFYIGNSVNNIDADEYNVEVDDELLDFMRKLRRDVCDDDNILLEIDPYSDVIIPKEKLSKMIEFCDCMLEKFFLANYEEGRETFLRLREISQKAIEQGLSLISVGD